MGRWVAIYVNTVKLTTVFSLIVGVAVLQIAASHIPDIMSHDEHAQWHRPTNERAAPRRYKKPTLTLWSAFYLYNKQIVHIILTLEIFYIPTHTNSLQKIFHYHGIITVFITVFVVLVICS